MKTYRTYIITEIDGKQEKLIVESGLSRVTAFNKVTDYNYPDPFSGWCAVAPIVEGEMGYEEES